MPESSLPSGLKPQASGLTATCIIPARFASTRFAGKVLANRTGKPMIQHVCERAALATSVAEVIVATDDERIRRAVEAFGGTVVMTRADHPNGTSRIAEAAASVSSAIVVNVQGDEPEIEPGLIDIAVAHLAAHEDCPVGTVASPFASGDDPSDPNIVKVALDRAGRALLFSRALIPHARDAGNRAASPLRHVGLYVYRREFLATYAALPPTPLEQTEQLEQLRILEHGYRIAVAVAASHHAGIDTEAQYDAFVRRRAAEDHASPPGC